MCSPSPDDVAVAIPCCVFPPQVLPYMKEEVKQLPEEGESVRNK